MECCRQSDRNEAPQVSNCILKIWSRHIDCGSSANSSSFPNWSLFAFIHICSLLSFLFIHMPIPLEHRNPFSFDERMIYGLCTNSNPILYIRRGVYGWQMEIQAEIKIGQTKRNGKIFIYCTMHTDNGNIDLCFGQPRKGFHHSIACVRCQW